jgi:hypothetical protein
MVAQQRPPAGDWQAGLGYWFAVMVYGMAMGLVASGVYDAMKGMMPSLPLSLPKGEGKE